MKEMIDFVTAESAIRQLQARCVDAVWRKDSEAFADCFADNGEWKLAGMHLHGRAEIKRAFEKLLGACERVFTLMGTPILELGDGVASARTYILEQAKLLNGQTASTLGVYYEPFIEQPGGWKFQWRHWALQYRGPADLTAPFHNSPDYGPPPGMPGHDDLTTVRVATETTQA